MVPLRIVAEPVEFGSLIHRWVKQIGGHADSNPARVESSPERSRDLARSENVLFQTDGIVQVENADDLAERRLRTRSVCWTACATGEVWFQKRYR
jgi:hypothetical protein